MKKTNVLLSLATICLAVMFTACGGFSNYTEVIPNDPVAVAKINVGELLTKSDILADKQFSGAINDGIEDECDAKTRKLLKEIIKDPNKSGLNVNQPTYVILENVEHVKGFILSAVKSENDLKTLIETLLDDEELKLRGIYLEKKNDMYTIEDKKGNAWAAFDDSKFVFAFTNNKRPDATEYMQPDESSESKSNGLQDFLNSNDDIATWIDYHQIARFVVPELNQELNMRGFLNVSDFEGSELVYSCNFENGRIVGKYKFIGDNKFIQAYKDITENTSGDLLQYIPKNSFGAIQIGLKNLVSVFDLLPTSMRSELDRELEKLNQNLANSNNPFELSYSILNSIDGDIAIGVTPMLPEEGEEMPQLIAIAECKNSDLFDTIIKALKSDGEDISEIGTDVYALNYNKRTDWSATQWNYERGEYDYVYIRRGYDYYFGYRDGKMFIMPENFYKNNLKALSPNFSDNPLASDMKGICNAVVDMHAIVDNLDNMTGFSRKDKAIFSYLRIIKSASITANENNSCELTISFADDKTNSLKQVKDAIFEIVISESIR